MKPTLHLIGIFHTVHNQAYSHCAFTGKALRFPRMMQEYGWKVIEYSNEGSKSSADEKVVMIDAVKFNELRGNQAPSDFHGDSAVIGNAFHTEFERNLRQELRRRVRPGDIICHPFGHAHELLVSEFTQARHVESGIGYGRTVPGTFKIFESYAWRHTHIERDKRDATNYEWVIPNYFDLDEWPVQKEHKNYVAFMGRISDTKGMDTVLEIARRIDIPVRVAGQGDMSRWAHPNLIYVGPLVGRERADFIGNAVCSLMPSKFVEPFGGSGVEGMLCGTPLVSVGYGAFTETVVPGLTGYRCQTLLEWLEAVNKCRTEIDRSACAAYARKRYSLESCGLLYDRAFRMIQEHNWYAGTAKL